MNRRLIAIEIPTAGAHLFAIVVGVAILVLVAELVRRRQLRDKYALLWCVLAVGLIGLAFVPSVLSIAARALDVVEPSSVLFVVALLVVLGVLIHLSWELSRLEFRMRSLAEHVALLHLRLDEHAVVQPYEQPVRPAAADVAEDGPPKLD